jgi:hypothetical protein
MAASFRLFGESDRSVVYWSGIFYVATCWLILTTFAPRFGFDAAFLSAIAFAVSRCGIMYARSGLTESAAMFFLVLVFAFFRDSLSFARGLLLGIVFSISTLNRPIALAWAFGAASVMAFPGATARRRFTPLGGMICGASAVLLAAKLVPGSTSPSTSFALNLAYGVGDPEQAFTSPLAFVLSHPVAFVTKMAVQFARPLVYLFRFGDIPVLSGIAPFGLLLCLNEGQRTGRKLLLAMLLSNALFLSMLMSGDAFVGPLRYFDVFAPLLLPWGVQLLLHFGNGLSGGFKIGFRCMFALALLGSAAQAIRNPFPSTQPLGVYSALRDAVKEGEVIAASTASDPTSIAWYTDRRTLVLEPDSPQVILKLRRQGLRVDWVLTTHDEQPPFGFQAVRSWPIGLILWHSKAGPPQ